MNTDGSTSKNKEDNYLKCRYNGQVYKYSDSTLALYLPSGASSVNTLMPKFEAENIKVWTYISGEVCEEAVLIFNTEDIHRIHKIIKIKTMGSNQQLKNLKLKQKQDKLKAKLKEESNKDKNK